MVYLTTLMQQVFAATGFMGAALTVAFFAATTVGLRVIERRRRP